MGWSQMLRTLWADMGLLGPDLWVVGARNGELGFSGCRGDLGGRAKLRV